jgi:hypothetical protein
MILENEYGSPRDRHPVVNLLVIILMVGLAFVFVGPAIGFVLALPFYEGGGMTEMLQALQDPANNPDIKIPLYIVQGCNTVIGLIITPAIFMMSRRRALGDFFSAKGVDLVPVLLTAFAVVIFMAVNSVFIEWNAKLDFPEFANEFESWAREREDIAGELTKVLTDFSSPGELMLALVVIAVLPAIGEEIVFRGVIQNELYRATKNIHVSIWFAAVLFSAIHFQFFGFVPRLLLGALFGYLYYWSGNLMLAIVAHFVNNAVSVTALYLYQQGTFTFDIESEESAPVSLVIGSAVLTGGLLYYFYKYYQDRKTAVQ